MSGITVAGNILVDYVKEIKTYPNKGMLATITDETRGVGGCVPNTGIDLKRIDKNLPVKAIGRIGNDEAGAYVKEQMRLNGVEVGSVITDHTLPTSYSLVMTVKGTGERTFFHNRGANKAFNIEDIDVDKLDCDIFHIGYIMLLDSFDKEDLGGRTEMSKLLNKVQNKGIKTSIDLVSESSGNFRKVAVSALKYCDYVIINEVEACQIAELSPRKDNGELIEENIIEAMKRIIEFGVKDRVIIHCPEKAFMMDKSFKTSFKPSNKLPKGYIKGTVGAGDAFCAGALYGLYKGYVDEKILEIGNKVAASCLSAPDSTSGVNLII